MKNKSLYNLKTYQNENKKEKAKSIRSPGWKGTQLSVNLKLESADIPTEIVDLSDN